MTVAFAVGTHPRRMNLRKSDNLLHRSLNLTDTAVQRTGLGTAQASSTGAPGRA